MYTHHSLFQVSFYTSNLLHQIIKPIKAGLKKKNLLCGRIWYVEVTKKRKRKKNETGLAHDPIAN